MYVLVACYLHYYCYLHTAPVVAPTPPHSTGD